MRLHISRPLTSRNIDSIQNADVDVNSAVEN